MKSKSSMYAATVQRRDAQGHPWSRQWQALFVSHPSSRCVVSAHDVHRIGMLLFQVDAHELELEPYKPTGETRVRPVYFLRWVGKVGGGLDGLRLEYRPGYPRRADWVRAG